MDLDTDDLKTLLSTCVQATIALDDMTELQNTQLTRHGPILAFMDHLRSQQMQLMTAVSSLAVQSKERSDNCFWETECQTCTEEIFNRHFRMRRETFGLLTNLMKQGNSLHESICLEKCVAVAVYTLGTTEDDSAVSELFGVTRPTLCNVLLEFCSEAWKVLHARYLNHFPLSEDTVKDCVQGFKARGFPQCLAVLDACHFSADHRENGAQDCLSKDGECSIKLLALIDAKKRFLYVNIGSPGHKTNADIYASSQLKKQLDDCALLEASSVTFDEIKVPVFIVGDSKFKLAHNLLTPFAVVETDDQGHFNEALEKCHTVAQQAVLQLKVRFKRSTIGAGKQPQNVISIIKACCVLHNFLIENNDDVSQDWLQSEEELSRKAYNYERKPQAEKNDNTSADSAGGTKAVSIRAALAKYFGKVNSYKSTEGKEE